MERSGYRYLNIVTAIFTTYLIASNIIAVKIIDVFGIVVPAAVVIFPISYIFGDILTEVYGYARSRQVIWIALSGGWGSGRASRSWGRSPSRAESSPGYWSWTAPSTSRAG